jgi:hypothetical protein
MIFVAKRLLDQLEGLWNEVVGLDPDDEVQHGDGEGDGWWEKGGSGIWELGRSKSDKTGAFRDKQKEEEDGENGGGEVDGIKMSAEDEDKLLEKLEASFGFQRSGGSRGMHTQRYGNEKQGDIALAAEPFNVEYTTAATGGDRKMEETNSKKKEEEFKRSTVNDNALKVHLHAIHCCTFLL